MESLLAFLAVSALVIVTPGQDTVLTVRSTLLGGRRAGVLTALGVSTGQAVWTLAASAGITALLLASGSELGQQAREEDGHLRVAQVADQALTEGGSRRKGPSRAVTACDVCPAR